MKEMIEQLLDFTRARLGGGIPVDPDQVDLGVLCRNVVDGVGAAYPSARFDLDVPGRLVVPCDRDRMFQVLVLVNLATNAWVHGSERHPIVVRLKREELAAAVSVENHGEPIPADVAVELFNPFRRLEEARPEQPHQGLGLGLYIAREIMVAHRGGIRVECVDGKVIFSARLPLPPA